jgi:hypothetical protein
MIRVIRCELAHLFFTAAVLCDKKAVAKLVGEVSVEAVTQMLGKDVLTVPEAAALRERGARLNGEMDALIKRMKEVSAYLREKTIHRKDTAVDKKCMS